MELIEIAKLMCPECKKRPLYDDGPYTTGRPRKRCSVCAAKRHSELTNACKLGNPVYAAQERVRRFLKRYLQGQQELSHTDVSTTGSLQEEEFCQGLLSARTALKRGDETQAEVVLKSLASLARPQRDTPAAKFQNLCFLTTWRDVGRMVKICAWWNVDALNQAFDQRDSSAEHLISLSTPRGMPRQLLNNNLAFHANLHRANRMAASASDWKAVRSISLACDISLIEAHHQPGESPWHLIKAQNLISKAQVLIDCGSLESAQVALDEAERRSRMTDPTRIDYLQQSVNFNLRFGKNLGQVEADLAEADGLISKLKQTITPWPQFSWQAATARLRILQDGKKEEAEYLLSNLAVDGANAKSLHYYELARTLAREADLNIRLPELGPQDTLRFGALIPSFYHDTRLLRYFAGL